MPAYFYSQSQSIFAIFYHFNFNFRCFSIYSDEIDIRNRIYSSRSIEWCNRNLERTSKTFFLNDFSIFRKRIFGFIQVFDIFESNRSNVTLSSFSSHQIPWSSQSMSSNGHYFDQLWTKVAKKDYLGLQPSKSDFNSARSRTLQRLKVSKMDK